MSARVVHVNTAGLAQVRKALKGLSARAKLATVGTRTQCGSAWGNPREAGCPTHVVVTGPDRAIVQRLEAANIAAQVTDTDWSLDVETVGEWTRPPCSHS